MEPNIDMEDKNNMTPLHSAVISRNIEVLTFLISTGANVNAKNINGWTPLHYAAGARGDNVEIVEFLVSKGADVNVKNNDGETPLDVARKCKNAKIAQFWFHDIYAPVKKENSIAAYADYFSKYPDAPNRQEALRNMYELVERENSMERYQWFYSTFPQAPQAAEAKRQMNELVAQENQRKKELVAQKNRQQYELVKNADTIAAYAWYCAKYPNAPHRNDALTDMYELVKKENSVAGYVWFLVNYPDAPQAAAALKRMHTAAFNAAKQINTVEALNDFIIAYPAAKEAKYEGEAYNLAFRLEKEHYTAKTREAKEDNARELLNRSKRIRLNGKKVEPTLQHGYDLVVGRMTELLEKEFIDQKATSEMLDSEEFRIFQEELRQSLGYIRQSLHHIENAIHQNTAQMTALIRQQISVMTHHFGIQENLLRHIASSTHATAMNTGAIAHDTRNISRDVGIAARYAPITAYGVMETMRGVQGIAEQMPGIVDSLNRRTQSVEYHNWHAGQSQNFIATRHAEVNGLKKNGFEMVKNPLFPNRSWITPAAR